MYPVTRLRRLRRTPALRGLVRETRLSPEQLILPLFVREGDGDPIPIRSMPGQFQYPLAHLAQVAREARSAGLPAVILFGIPHEKDARGSEAMSVSGIVQRAIAALKSATPELLVLADACLCEFTDHGHCGWIAETRDGRDVDNDSTLRLLEEAALSQARAGADVIAPSGMMDGMVQAIRGALDGGGYSHVPIMSYAAKYASAYYGPFRDAAESPPQFGDRSTYQMDPANGAEALREVALDLAEGADILMVKPALAYLDIIQRVKAAHPEVPLAAYNVSGEYAMIKAAAAQGWLDEQRTVLETLLSIRRAGADMILTYHALDVARWLA